MSTSVQTKPTDRVVSTSSYFTPLLWTAHCQTDLTKPPARLYTNILSYWHMLVKSGCNLSASSCQDKRQFHVLKEKRPSKMCSGCIFFRLLISELKSQSQIVSSHSCNYHHCHPQHKFIIISLSSLLTISMQSMAATVFSLVFKILCNYSSEIFFPVCDTGLLLSCGELMALIRSMPWQHTISTQGLF